MGFQQDHYVWRTSGERTQAIILDPVLPGSEVRLIDGSHVHTSPAENNHFFLHSDDRF